MKRTLFFQRIGQLCIPLLAVPAFANNIDVDVSASTRFSDNATRRNSNTISERQDQYGIKLLADYINSLIDFDTNLSASEHTFSKDSQPDRSLFEGDLNLLIGKQDNPVDLLLSYSRRSLLNAPDQVDLLQNRDERSIFSAAPTFRLRVSPVTSVSLRGELTEIDYRYTNALNSDRTGGTLSWLHLFSSVSNVAVAVQHTDVSYEISSASDYEYERASITYATQLRQLSYLISLGYNTSTPENGKELSSPSYQVKANYQSGFNTFSFELNQRITDTSRGSGNRGELGNINLGDASGVGIDQFESQIAELRWTNQAVCDRCSIYASLLYEADDYVTLEEDGDQNVISAGFEYQLSRASSLGFRVTRNERNFEANVARDDYTRTSFGVDYRHTFASDLSLRIFANADNGDSDSTHLTYDENVTGLALTYTF